MATMFITLQGKGGVGKSFLTAAFAQWLVDRGRSVACIDTDTLNPTLLQYASLQATHIWLSQNHVIDPRALDALVGIVTEEPADAHVVVDVGSNGFETLMAYEVENGVFALLAELGHQVVMQTAALLRTSAGAARPASQERPIQRPIEPAPTKPWLRFATGALLGTGATAVLALAAVVWAQLPAQ